MKKAITFMFMFIVFFCHAQKKDSLRFAKNTFFLEGSEVGYSINYDRIILHKYNDKLSVRVGLGLSQIRREHIASALEIQYFYGRSHHVGLGAGIMLQDQIRVHDATPLSINTRYGILYGTFKAVYRYQRPRGGIFFRIGFVLAQEILKVYSYTDTGESWSVGAGGPVIGLGYSF